MTAYHDKVYGCWLGKCLGGAIGMAYEGVPFQPELTEQDIALQDVPNDDLELQLVWLMALKKHGLGLDHRKLGQIWLDHIPHGVDEYSFALRNLNRGILPPASGWKDSSGRRFLPDVLTPPGILPHWMHPLITGATASGRKSTWQRRNVLPLKIPTARQL